MNQQRYVPIELSYLEFPASGGPPEEVTETRYLYYTAHSVERFQREIGMHLDDMQNGEAGAVLSEKEREQRLRQILKQNDISMMRFTAIMLWSGLIASEPSLTVDEVASMIQARDFERVVKKSGQAFQMFAESGLPEAADEQSKEPEAVGNGKKTSGDSS